MLHICTLHQRYTRMYEKYEHICTYITISTYLRTNLCVLYICSVVRSTYLCSNICRKVHLSIYESSQNLPIHAHNIYLSMHVVRKLTNSLQHTATHCNTLQLTATHRNTLQHTATHRNTLQHTATHCNALQHTKFCCQNTDLY